MKHLETPFVAAFLLGALFLVLAYVGALSRPAEPTDYLWYESLQQLNELCRTKYRHSHHYSDCARRAETDSLGQMAALFTAMARADAVQCDNCRRAIESLGGVFHTPVVIASEGYPLDVHLRQAMEDKSELHEEFIRRCVSRALDDGNRYVARLLTWCDASDVRQVLILRRELEHIGSGDAMVSERNYIVCPTCGNLLDEALHAHFCPHCMTDSEQFEVYGAGVPALADLKD